MSCASFTHCGILSIIRKHLLVYRSIENQISARNKHIVVATPILVDCSSYDVEDDWISISKCELMVFFYTTFFFKKNLPISNVVHVAFAKTHTHASGGSRILKSGIFKPKLSKSCHAIASVFVYISCHCG